MRYAPSRCPSVSTLIPHYSLSPRMGRGQALFGGRCLVGTGTICLSRAVWGIMPDSLRWCGLLCLDCLLPPFHR